MSSFNGNTLTYDNRGRVETFGEIEFEYDNYGNRTKKKNNVTGETLFGYAWTRGRLLQSVGEINFVYDRNGVRSQKKNGDTVISEYFYDGNKLIAEKRGDDYFYFFYDENGVCGFRYKDINYEYVKNIFGDIIGIYNEYGTHVATYAYDAWGNMIYCNAGTDVALINPFLYRGYYFDTESGLYYLMSRYYDPTVGQFISRDPAGYLKSETIGGVDLYAYCNNNPVMYNDPTGHLAGWAIALILAGAVLAMTASTLAYGASTKETIVIDVSLSIPLGGPNWKLGVSVVIDFENEWIEFYPHTGGSIGLSSGLSFSFGKIENYEKQGDYEGVFIFGGGGYYGGLDHCFGPFDPYQEAVKATSVTIGGGGSVYFGVDYYIYVPEWTIYW